MMMHRLLLLLLVLISCGPEPGLRKPVDAADNGWQPVLLPAPERPVCSQAKLDQILDTSIRAGVLIDCHLTLPPDSVVTRQLLWIGEASSGTDFNCRGSTIAETTATAGTDSIIVRSRATATGWEPVHDVTIRGCIIHGSVRLSGLARNGEGDAYVQSSQQPAAAHVATVRDAAPYRITLTESTIIGVGRNPVYFGPGVHRSRFITGVVRGSSNDTLIYLGAESTRNHLVDLDLNAEAIDGPAIKIDSSSRNHLVGNRLRNLNHGGIELFWCHRNGGLRATTPSHNTLLDTQLWCDASATGIYLGSRSRYFWCDDYCRDNEVLGSELHRCLIKVGPGHNVRNVVGPSP
jgi:hypothetical protein